MQLKRRMIKPDYWTDTEIGKELPPEGKLLYIGLWQLAEDSGVIENDPLAFKMLLFPLDDIEDEQIVKWIEKLKEMGKLIPYEVDNKDCFYLKNFHKHQSLRNPARPELPLPDFIRYIPNPKKHKSGGYIIDYNDFGIDKVKKIGNFPDKDEEDGY